MGAPSLSSLLKAVAVSVLLTSTTIWSQEKACKKEDWFGDRCQHKCHCAKGGTFCDNVTGVCTGSCESGWFGPSCQYRVAHLSSSLYGALPDFLLDNDDLSCNNNNNDTSFHATFEDPYWFTWMRYRVRDPDYINSLYVELDAEEGECRNFTRREVDAFTMDLHCPRTVKVTSVVITGDAVLLLCALHISGGRNVALKQLSEQTSTDGTWYSAQAVDGRLTDPGYEDMKRCSSTKEDEKEGMWTLTLNPPVFIVEFVLHYSRKKAHGFKQFTITMYSGEKKYEYKNPNGKSARKYNIRVDEVRNVKIDKITMKKSETAKEMAMCEFEVFGDSVCKTGFFGLDCVDNCNCKTPKSECLANGACPDGCLPGYTGASCGAAKIDIECKEPVYGDECQYKCNCLNEEERCHLSTGWCRSGCKKGYTGVDCKTKLDEPKCVRKFYGRGCKQTCNCKRPMEACDITGFCPQSGCKEGFTGTNCHEPDVPTKSHFIFDDDKPSSSKADTSRKMRIADSIAKWVAIVVGALVTVLILCLVCARLRQYCKKKDQPEPPKKPVVTKPKDVHINVPPVEPKPVPKPEPKPPPQPPPKKVKPKPKPKPKKKKPKKKKEKKEKKEKVVVVVPPPPPEPVEPVESLSEPLFSYLSFPSAHDLLAEDTDLDTGTFFFG